MKKVLYLMLSAALIVAVLGIVKSSRVYRKNLSDTERRSAFLPLIHVKKISSRDTEVARNIVGSKDANEAFLTSLPCFSCHNMAEWEGVSTSGSFSHATHISFGMHCLDCHRFVAHGEGMRVAEEACVRCH